MVQVLPPLSLASLTPSPVFPSALPSKLPTSDLRLSLTSGVVVEQLLCVVLEEDHRASFSRWGD